MSLPLARELFPKIIGDLAVSLVGVKKFILTNFTHKLHSQSGLQPGRLLNCPSQAIRLKQRQLPILYGCSDSEFYANLPGNRRRTWLTAFFTSRCRSVYSTECFLGTAFVSRAAFEAADIVGKAG